jgi:cytochrome c biogenesis protein ResB
MGLMSLLVLNTLVCTFNRVTALIRRRKEGSGGLDYLLLFSPHLMHLAFVVLLSAMLASYLGGTNLRNNVVRQGGVIQVAGTGFKIRLDKIQVDFYQGRRLSFFQGRALDQKLSLTFIDDQGRETKRDLGLNRPVRYQGHSVHIKNYQPQRENRADRPGWANLIIRQDPGVGIFFLGVGMFIIGLAGYLAQSLKKRGPARNKGLSNEAG